jgi:hypothetical protein
MLVADDSQLLFRQCDQIGRNVEIWEITIRTYLKQGVCFDNFLKFKFEYKVILYAEILLNHGPKLGDF